MDRPHYSQPRIRVRSGSGTHSNAAGQASPHVVDLRSANRAPEHAAPEPHSPAFDFFESTKSQWTPSEFDWNIGSRLFAVVSRAMHGARMWSIVIIKSPLQLVRAVRDTHRQWRSSREEGSPDHGQALWRALQDHPFLPSLPKELLVVITLGMVVMVAASVAQSIPNVESQKQHIIQEALSAVGHVSAATDSFSKGDWPQSLDAIVQARATFEQMNKELEEPDQWFLRLIGLLPINTRYHQARRITAVGKQLSTAAQSIVQAAVLAQGPEVPGDKLRGIAAYATQAHESISSARQQLQAVEFDQADPALGQLSRTLGETLSAAEGSVGELRGLLSVLGETMGSNQLRRYLVIFENSDEIRPAGGFMGSFVLIDVVNGVIIKQEYPKGGSYDLQGSLALSARPPKPLSVFKPQWQFQDVNWFSDWPTSAKTIQWFYQNAGGPTVDGVIAITSPVLERVLAIMGPIELGGEQLSADSVIRIVQHNVEKKYDRAKNNPKEYIGNLAAALQQKMLTISKEQMIQLFQLSQAAVHEKLIMAYMNDPVLERQLQSLGVAGEIKATPGDYLSMIWANIGGEKTDRVIERTAVLTSAIDGSGSITNTLKIRRHHAGKPGELFYGRANTAYLRVYVPQGAQLVSSRGFIPMPRPIKTSETPTNPVESVQEYDDRQRPAGGSVVQTQEYGKTVFGGWVTLAVGATQEIELTYRLSAPMQSEKSHTLLVQKQPGGVQTDFSYVVQLPERSTVVAAAPASIAKTSGSTVAYPAEPLISDRFYGTIAQLP
ncbi:DUF4012 domain-containing protein [Candidatus Uhrbacteria bacterium]|nr:DUF4012 domain-containing protein [Candidatus Uhrbacteria bacterium]